MPSAPPQKPSTSRNRSGNEDETGSWFESMLGPDGTPTDATKQMIIGGVSGWVTGFLAMKVGRAAAAGIGGGIILLQIASHQGYININWSRLQRDVDNVKNKITEGDQKKKDWTAKLENKIDKLANKAEDMANRLESKSKTWYDKLVGRESRDLHYFITSFAVGTVVGLVTGG